MGAWCCDMWLPPLEWWGCVYLEYLLLSEWKLLVSLCYGLAKTRCYIRTTYIVAQLTLLCNMHCCTLYIVADTSYLDQTQYAAGLKDILQTIPLSGNLYLCNQSTSLTFAVRILLPSSVQGPDQPLVAVTYTVNVPPLSD